MQKKWQFLKLCSGHVWPKVWFYYWYWFRYLIIKVLISKQFSKFVYIDTCKSEGPEYRKNMPIIKVTITESTAFIKIIFWSKIPRWKLKASFYQMGAHKRGNRIFLDESWSWEMWPLPPFADSDLVRLGSSAWQQSSITEVVESDIRACHITLILLMPIICFDSNEISWILKQFPHLRDIPEYGKP